jgi:hypothetical protein
VNGIDPSPFGRPKKDADMPAWMALAALIGLAGFFSYVGLVWMANARAGSRCLAAGYPSHRVTITLDAYCTTVDKSIPLAEVP